MNTEKIRNDFPLYQRKINGMKPIYMDSACVTLKPKQVIEELNKYYTQFPACAGRSAHTLGKEVTQAINTSRKTVQKFINAKRQSEIIFTRNTTEGINLLAHSLKLENGDAVLTSDKEHNSGLIPFQLLKRKGIVHKTFEFGNMDDYKNKLTADVKLVSTVVTSNLDGTSQPIKDMIKQAHQNKSYVLLDGAQAVPHQVVDVRKLNADFLVFSGHKMLGPSGTGILYGKSDLLENLDPFIMGGETVKDSTLDSFEIEDIPERFEAGLQNYAGIIGLAEAIKYLEKVGMKKIQSYEHELNRYVSEKLTNEGITILGHEDPAKRGGIISFNIRGIDPHEIAGILNENANIMIRSGMHCVHSWFNKYKIEGSARISLYLYNTKEECDVLVEKIKEIAAFAK